MQTVLCLCAEDRRSVFTESFFAKKLPHLQKTSKIGKLNVAAKGRNTVGKALKNELVHFSVLFRYGGFCLSYLYQFKVFLPTFFSKKVGMLFIEKFITNRQE